MSPSRAAVPSYRELGFSFAATLLAVEKSQGPNALRQYEDFLIRQQDSTFQLDDTGRGESRWLDALDRAEERTFGVLIDKFAEIARIPANLSLETASERNAFDWLVGLEEDSGVRRLRDTRQLAIVETMAAPGISGLDPKDIIALRDDGLWLDYRLALTRALDRISAVHDLEPAESAEVVREEIRAAERAANRATSRTSFTADRARVGRDVVIGTVVAAATIPIVGIGAAGLAAGVLGGRSGAQLIWSWLRSRSEASAKEATARCFGAFG